MSSFTLLFLALSLYCSLQFVGSVSANFFPASVPAHSIEITANGEVNGTDKIQRSGNIYTFTGDVVGSIVVSRSGIVIDGAGYTLQGNGNLTGIWLQEKNNVEVKNLHIRNFRSGIILTFGWSLDGCTDITLSGNTITDNQENGINFFESPNVRIVGNAITENIGYGVKLWFHSNNCSIYHNNFVNNEKSALADSQPTCWDNGTAGNYWGDYTGVDNNGDGIGDTSYSIGDGNTDIYPLMEPFEVPETEIPDGIPEFPSWTPFLIVLVAVTALAIIYNRRILNEKCRSR